MEATYNLNVIVLKRDDFRENDSRVIVFSKEKGRLELVVRGAKKIKSKLASHLEPLNLVEIMAIHGRNFDYAGTALSSECFPNIKSDLEKLNFSVKAIGIFSALIKDGEGTSAEVLFYLLKDYLEIIDKANDNLEFIHHIFLLKLLSELGYKPELENCSVCSKKIVSEKIFFSNRQGGTICPACGIKEGESKNISESSLNLFKSAIKNTIESLVGCKIDKILEKEFVKISNDYFRYISEK